MREPRVAAEGRRFDERRNDVAARGADVGRPAARGSRQARRELRPVVADGAVRLDENQEDVGALDAGEIGVDRRRRPTPLVRAAVSSPADEPGLPRVGRRRPATRSAGTAGHGGEEALAGEEQQRRRRPAGPALGARRHGPSPSPIRPSAGRTHRVEDQPERARRRRGRDRPATSDAARAEHGGDGGDVAHVPVQVDLAAVQRGRRDVRVPADDQHDPERCSGIAGRGGRAGPSRRLRAPAAQNTRRHFDRHIAVPAHRRRRPEVAKRQRSVEDQRAREPARPSAIRRQV